MCISEALRRQISLYISILLGQEYSLMLLFLQILDIIIFLITTGINHVMQEKRGELRKCANLPFQRFLHTVLVALEVFVWLVLLLMPRRRLHARRDSERTALDYI